MDQKEHLPAIEARPMNFWQSPDDSYHPPATIAVTIGCAESSLQNWRCGGGGPKFVRRGRIVLYRKADVVSWLSSFEGPMASTSDLAENDCRMTVSKPQAA